MKTAVFLLFVGLCRAQDVTSVMSIEDLALLPRTTPLTITATNGDGSTLTLNKIPGPTIFAFLAWTNSAGTAMTSPIIIRIGGTVAVPMHYRFGSIGCVFVANPTNTAITYSIGVAPAGGIAWQCSTETTPGSFTAPQAGNVAWP